MNYELDENGGIVLWMHQMIRKGSIIPESEKAVFIDIHKHFCFSFETGQVVEIKSLMKTKDNDRKYIEIPFIYIKRKITLSLLDFVRYFGMGISITGYLLILEGKNAFMELHPVNIDTSCLHPFAQFVMGEYSPYSPVTVANDNKL